jgi:hypothetical protein
MRERGFMSNPSGWTVETLKEYVETLIEANDKRYNQRFDDAKTAVDAALNAAKTAVGAALDAQKEAVAKAEQASEKRFDGVNEFRETLSDQQRTLIPRAEADLRFGNIEKELATLKSGNAERRGKQIGASSLWAAIIAGVSVLVALASAVFAIRK